MVWGEDKGGGRDEVKDQVLHKQKPGDGDSEVPSKFSFWNQQPRQRGGATNVRLREG